MNFQYDVKCSTEPPRSHRKHFYLSHAGSINATHLIPNSLIFLNTLH